MKRRLLALFFVPSLLVSLLLPLLDSAPVSAATLTEPQIDGATYTFQDRGAIIGDFNGNKVTFYDKDVFDSNNNYAPSESGNFCSNYPSFADGIFGIDIKSSATFNGATIPAFITVGYLKGQNCVSVNKPISISNPNNVADHRFEWSGSDITTLADQNSDSTAIFSRGNNQDNYQNNNNFDASGNCEESTIILSSGSKNKGTLFCYYSPAIGDQINPFACPDIPPSVNAPSGWCLDTIISVNISGAPGTTPPDGGGGGGSAHAPKLSCTIGSITGLLNPLNWVLCPAISGMSDIIGFVDDAITSQLSVGSSGNSDTPNQIFCNNGTCNAYHEAWSSFRDIALGLMVMAGLIILISQALGMEILDAYTVRKTLPRLLIAAVGITLSWQLMQFFVQFTNDLGYGVRSLIYYPFTHALGDSITVNASSFASNGESLLAGIGYLAIGAFGLLTLAASGALALLIAFFVLVLRQIAVIVLIITAPIAIFAYILPNTQNIYKLWWDSFSRALLMFPLIAGFIAAGHVFSLIAFQNKSALFQFAAFVAYFAPYFLIPATFKLAGSAIRQIGGFVNDRGRGGFDMLRNARKQRTASRVKAYRTGGLYREDFGQFGKKGRSIGKMLNKAGSWTFDLDEQAPLTAGLHNVPGFKRGAKKGVADINAQKIEQNREAAQKAGVDYRLGWAIGSNFHRFRGSGGLDEENYRNLEEAFGTGPRNRSGALIRDQNGNYTGGFREVVGNDLENLQSILSTGTDGSDALFAANQVRMKKGTLMRLTDKDNDESRRADLHSMGIIMSAAEGRLEDPELNSIAKTGSSVDAQYSQRLGEEAQRLTTQKRPEFALGHGVRVRRNADGQLENYSVYDREHFQSAETKKALMRLKVDEPQQGKAEFWDTTDAAWLHHANEQSSTYDPVTHAITTGYSDDAKQLRSFIVQQGGYYSRNDPGAKIKIEGLKQRLGITKEEEAEYMRGFDPSDPRNQQGPPPQEDDSHK